MEPRFVVGNHLCDHVWIEKTGFVIQEAGDSLAVIDLLF